MFTTVTYVTAQEPGDVRTATVPDGEFYADWIAQRDDLDHPNYVWLITTDVKHPIYEVSTVEHRVGHEPRRIVVGHIAFQPNSGLWEGRQGGGSWTSCQTLASAIRQAKRRFYQATVTEIEVAR